MPAGPTAPVLTPVQERVVSLAIAGLGFSAVLTQLVLMRELLGVFAGSELVLGVILGNWLLLTGLGAALGRFVPRLIASAPVLVTLLILVALLPPVQVVLLRILRDVVFIRGELIGVVPTVLSSFLLLLPYCLLSGFLLTQACALLSAGKGARALARVYLSDSLGSLLGGLAFTFVLIHFLDHAALLCVPGVICLLLAGLTARAFARKFLAGLSVVLLVSLLAVLGFCPLDQWSTAVLYPAQKLLLHANSPYGRLVVTASAGQVNVYANGLPVLSSGNVQAVEEAVHFAMSQRPAARRVLLISGGFAGATREILKYPVEEVTYIEQDPLLLAAARRFFPQNLDDPRLRVVAADGRQFLRRADGLFDVVILDVPDPSTSQLNRFFSREFFQDVKRRLAPAGVLALPLGHYENHVSRELERMLASAAGTLRECFQNVLALPGGRVYLLASDGPLTADIASCIAAARVSTLLMNPDYLEAALAPDRLAEIQQALQGPSAVNTDLNPVLYYYHLVYWISQFEVSFGILEGLLLVVLAVYLVRLGPTDAVIFASGFAASSLEIVLLLAMQILCGTLYQQLGLVVTTFMAGLAVGAFWADRTLSHAPASGLEHNQPGAGQAVVPVAPSGSARKILLVLALGLAGFAAFLTPVLSLLGHFESAGFSAYGWPAAICALTFLLALLVGLQFPLAGRVTPGSAARTASRLYTADFVGACLGALLTSTLLIPLCGVTITCLLVAGLNLLAAVLLRFRK